MVFTMSKKINKKFLKLYVELDKVCCDKFGIPSDGVTEYINRLSNTKFAPKRDEVLPALVKYRNMNNLFAHQPKDVKKNKDLVKGDLTWIKGFKKDVSKKKDPLSVYLKKARKYVRGKKFRRFLLGAVIVAAVAAAGVFAYLQFLA